MPTLKTEYFFHIEAETLWQMIGSFENPILWAAYTPVSCNQEDTGVGSLRTIELQDGNSVIEKLIAVASLGYSYSLIKPFPPYSVYHSQVFVTPINKRECKLTIKSTFESSTLSDDDLMQCTKQCYDTALKVVQKAVDEKKQNKLSRESKKAGALTKYLLAGN